MCGCVCVCVHTHVCIIGILNSPQPAPTEELCGPSERTGKSIPWGPAPDRSRNEEKPLRPFQQGHYESQLKARKGKMSNRSLYFRRIRHRSGSCYSMQPLPCYVRSCVVEAPGDLSSLENSLQRLPMITESCYSPRLPAPWDFI